MKNVKYVQSKRESSIHLWPSSNTIKSSSASCFLSPLPIPIPLRLLWRKSPIHYPSSYKIFQYIYLKERDSEKLDRSFITTLGKQKTGIFYHLTSKRPGSLFIIFSFLHLIWWRTRSFFLSPTAWIFTIESLFVIEHERLPSLLLVISELDPGSWPDSSSIRKHITSGCFSFLCCWQPWMITFYIRLFSSFLCIFQNGPYIHQCRKL